MKILRVRIDNLSKAEIIEKIKVFLTGDCFHQIATINPEFVLRARKDEEFKNILNSCDLNVADGTGIWFAFLRFGKCLKSRMAGVDLMEEILKIASKNNCKIFLAASDRGLSPYEDTREAILKKYPNLEIGGANLDIKKCHSGLDPESKEILNQVQDDKYNIKFFDIIFVNFGSPEQEKFLHSLRSQENAKIRLSMGVGGSFDFITGKIKRAPLLMRKLGLEWLWRFILEPQYRFKRIINAVLIFPVRILFSKND